MEGAVLDTDALINTARIGRLQITVAILGGFVLFVDGFDTQVIAYITPQIARIWQIPRDMLGPIFSSGLVGLLVGYLFVSPLSGKYGHKRVVIACTAIFGALTFLTAHASGTDTLILFRFLTGIGLGGAIPSAVASTGEFAPLNRRSTFITFMYCGLSFGQLAAGAVSAALLQRFGWQSVLYVGGSLPLILAVALAIFQPESIEYLINRAHDRPRAIRLLKQLSPETVITDRTVLLAGDRSGQGISVAQLFQSRRTLGTLAIWIGLFINLMVNFFLQNWLPTIFIQIGLSQQTAILTTAVSMAGGIAAAFVIGPLMDWLGPYLVMAALFVGGAVFVGLIGLSLAWPVTVLGAIAFLAGFCLSGIQKSANALCIYFYPTALRSTGLGWGLGIGRIGAIIGPLAVGAMLVGLKWNPASVFYAAGVPMLIGAVAMVVMGRFYGTDRGDSLAAVGGERLERSPG